MALMACLGMAQGLPRCILTFACPLQAGFPELATKILEQLAHNAVAENR